MDPSSIITQVAPPDEDDASAAAAKQSASSSAAAAAAAAAPIASPTSSNPDDGTGCAAGPNNAGTVVDHVNKGDQKESKKRSNMLCAIICCFGKSSKKSGSGYAKSKKNGKEVNGNSATSKVASFFGGGGGGSAGSGGGGDSSGLDGSSNNDGLDGVVGGISLNLGLGKPSGGQGGKASACSSSKHLLPELKAEDLGKKCIVIDLDETLVHSSFKPISNADFIVPVEIDNVIHQVYVLKRPFVDEFLCRVGELFECVLFTASLAKYADPVADLLDKWDVFRSRLFRESCVFHKGNYVKDLSRLGRELHKIIIVDNSPASYIFHPENAVPVSSWFDDMNDRELLDLIPFLENISQVDSVYNVLSESVNGQTVLDVSSDLNKNPLQQQQHVILM